MSAVFYTYRDGEKEGAYKYEKIDRIWFTKAKDGSDQISIYIGDKTHSSWGLGSDDQKLTQKSFEEASKKYTEALIKIESKKRASILGKRKRISNKIPIKKSKRRKVK